MSRETFSLMDVVCQAKPSVLVGVSGQPGLFSEAVIREMYRHCPQPIVMPLSNPTSRAEARTGRHSALDRRQRGDRHRQPVRAGKL